MPKCKIVYADSSTAEAVTDLKVEELFEQLFSHLDDDTKAKCSVTEIDEAPKEEVKAKSKTK